MGRLHSVIAKQSEYKQRTIDELPSRVVLVAWYAGVIAEDEQGNFYPSEFSTHIQVKGSNENGIFEYLIHGHYFSSFESALKDYTTRRL